ncbi:relaxase/mobilization nuclease domain-containing protein [Pedobacter endophyticus]|uniref:Relaxase/mobilization nuclease domain-containing protein n=1 Tax=Pedobacter endophyticus TaxID=2789740 RepID=A0A7U3SQ80_9SPHI|nr:relaxase/mobilization nuclease domain-containing protein [Pedobacter endophyticus]QPH38659.1 relaxase/mobilization nuclease domain-containing protein [Pedobacter endophyticus]
MIVKILQKSKTFSAVRYNTNKVEKDKGELLKVSGFEALSGFSELKPQDYINYLSSVAALNKKVVYPQFHAMISSKGRAADKQSLLLLAEKWLSGMGYGNQPYMLIFHKDTDNNHIHIVSSRVDLKGNKISDAFEKIRAYRVLNRLIGQDEKQLAAEAVTKALQYKFSTAAQYLMILEAKGYSVKLVGDAYNVSKFGELVAQIDISKIQNSLAAMGFSGERKLQLRKIFEKYKPLTDTKMFPVVEKHSGGAQGKILRYSSDLSERLSSDFGLEFVFHFNDGKSPYGYTILDHARKNVFKGGEIMALAKFAEVLSTVPHQSLLPLESGVPMRPGHFPEENMLLEILPLSGSGDLYSEFAEGSDAGDFSFGFDIADDIDDEQINGRNRRRQGKARTNTR